MIAELAIATSYVQLAIAVVALITALTAFDNRRAIRRHVKRRREARRKL